MVSEAKSGQLFDKVSSLRLTFRLTDTAKATAEAVALAPCVDTIGGGG